MPPRDRRSYVADDLFGDSLRNWYSKVVLPVPQGCNEEPFESLDGTRLDRVEFLGDLRVPLAICGLL